MPPPTRRVVTRCLWLYRRTRLELEADRINYKLRLDSQLLQAQDIRVNQAFRDVVPGGPTHNEIVHREGSHYRPYDFIFGQYYLDHEVDDPDAHAAAAPHDGDASPERERSSVGRVGPMGWRQPKRTLYRHDRRTRSSALLCGIDARVWCSCLTAGGTCRVSFDRRPQVGDLHH